MEILITGGTGGIGKKLIPILLQKGHHVSVLCRNLHKAKAILPSDCRIIIGDVTNPQSILDCCKGIDIVYHLVGISGNEGVSEQALARYRKVNVEGLRNMVNEAERAGVKRFVYVSSIAAMGLVKKIPINSESECNPIRPYAVSKYEAEQLLLGKVRDKGFPAIILRPAQVYGVGGEYTYQNIIQMVKMGFFPKVGYRDTLVSHCYIDDLITTLSLLVDNGQIGSIYISTTEKSIGFYESVRLIARLMNRKVFLIPIPRWLMISIAYIIENVFTMIGKVPPVTTSNIRAVTTDRVYDLSNNRHDLGFTSRVTMEDGIRRCVEYSREEGVF